MSETPGEYRIPGAVEGKPDSPLLCQGCARELGRMVERGGNVYLRVGALEVAHLDGACTCGALFHWSTTAQKLERIIRRRMERKSY